MAFPSSVTGFARATFPIPFVPSGHFPLTRGIGPRGRLWGRELRIAASGFALLAMTSLDRNIIVLL